jgi:hypothetical protein
MTGDKRVAEGLGFAISFPTLLELIPETFGIEEMNAAPIPLDEIQATLDGDAKLEQETATDAEPASGEASDKEKKSE